MRYKSNMATHGANTVEIAKKLKGKLDANRQRYKGVIVFYDHGKSSKPEVCEPKAYMGRRYGNDATLSDIDIVIEKNGKVFLAVEVEEGSVRPKMVLGDVFGIVSADRIQIRKKSHPIKNITLIVAIVVKAKGKQLGKYLRLERHLNGYLKKNPSDRLKKIRIIPCKIDDLVRRIERLIRLEIGKVTFNG